MATQADDATRADYRNSIELMADVIEENADDYGDIHEAVWESVDSSQWVIYTNKTLKVLQYADNDPGEWHHLVSDGDSWQEVVRALAYKMMENDLYDVLRDRDGVEL